MDKSKENASAQKSSNKRPRSKRYHNNYRIIAVNLFMAISALALMAVLLLFAMGYSFKKGSLEQSGLIEINSNPSGASVQIDENQIFNRTTINSMLSAGKHKITVTKEGYDTWSKDFMVESGLFTRIDWVRLFPTAPKIETATELSPLRLSSFSTNRKRLFVLEENATAAKLFDLQAGKLKPTLLPLHEILQEVFNGDHPASALPKEAKLSPIAWDSTAEKILFKLELDGKTSWHLANLSNTKESLNLSNKFGLSFDKLTPANDAVSKLWALEQKRLHLIDLENANISASLLSDVLDFTNNQDNLAVIQQQGQTRALGIYKNGETTTTPVSTLSKDAPVNLLMGTYWGNEWLAFSDGKTVQLLGGKYPSINNPNRKFKPLQENLDLTFTPTLFSKNAGGRLPVFADEDHIMVFDLERKKNFLSTPPAKLSRLDWLDNYLLWMPKENKIFVQDFDGQNRREILPHTILNSPINLTEDNHYLYYFAPLDDAKATTSQTTSSDHSSPSPQTAPKAITLQRITLE